MTVRLGSAFPQLGDRADGLYLQSFDVDLADLTARLEFGQPEHLSVEDMRNLLNGFRQRGYATTAKLRKNKADEDADEEPAPGGIPPISSSEWSPGTKVKATIKKSGGGTIKMDASSAGTIDLQTTHVGSGKEAKFRDLTYTDSNGDSQTVRVLAVDDSDEPSSVSDEDVEDPYDPDEPWDPSDPWNPDEPVDPENPDTPDDSGGGDSSGGGGCNGWSADGGGAGGGDPGMENDGDDCNILNGW
jgi:hypothetical protein